jgi:uncharacterized repeat protein (TIGR01451 family)
LGPWAPTIGGNSGQGAAYIFEGNFNPDLVISKSVTPASAQPGQSITYTLAFTNSGAGSATGVRITDTIPLSVTGGSVISSGAVITPVNGTRYAWQIGDLAPNDSGVITISGVLSSPLATGIFTNSAVITTTATDSDPLNNSAAVGLTVSNAPPVAADGSNSTAEDTPLSGTLSATDPNGDVLTYTLLTAPNPLSATVAITATSGGYVFTPTLNVNGVISFTFAVSDGLGSDNGVFTVTVTAQDDPPVAGDSSETTPEDTPFSGVFSVTEPDGDVLTYTLLTTPNPLTATVAITDANSGGYIFTPTLNVNGVVTFTFAVSDGLSSSSAGVTVTVTAQNDAPVAADGSNSTPRRYAAQRHPQRQPMWTAPMN